MVYSTDNILPVESNPSGQSNSVSVEYPCILIELMSGAKSRKWVHHNSTNQPTISDLHDLRLG